MTTKKTNKRASMPTVAAILKHWDEKFADEGLYDIISTNAKSEPVSACFACGSMLMIERAHNTALCNGGTNDLDNLHLLCRSCHSDSEVFSDEEYDDWFYWRINQPGYMAVRLKMLCAAGKLPQYEPQCNKPIRELDPECATMISKRQGKKMPIIKEDEHGLYVAGGGWKAREIEPNTTQYKVGDEVKTHHFGGTTNIGVGKNDQCKRGEYIERWMTSGIGMDETPSTEDAEKIQWYREFIAERG